MLRDSECVAFKEIIDLILFHLCLIFFHNILEITVEVFLFAFFYQKW